jgi:predicted anti-sigma-YlaC factor YlaD
MGKTMADPTGHPDLADLDAARTGEAAPEIDAHVRSCAECRRIVSELDAVGAALRTPVPPVPDAVEQRILWIAQKEAAAIRRAARVGAPATRRGFAVAAAVLLALGVLRAVVSWQGAQTPALVADVDGNGVVDIRDALLIARAARSAGDASSRFDVNGDHVVDAADADLAARTAVTLGAHS